MSNDSDTLKTDQRGSSAYDFIKRVHSGKQVVPTDSILECASAMEAELKAEISKRDQEIAKLRVQVRQLLAHQGLRPIINQACDMVIAVADAIKARL